MDDLLKTALVGTAKQPAACWLPHDTDAILSTAAANSLEQGVLLRAGLRSIYDQSGLAPTPDIMPLPAAQNDEHPLRGARITQILRQCLAPEAKLLLLEFLKSLRDAQKSLPYDLLPSVLEITDPSIREQLLPILGQRGLWLSRLNPRWEWASEGMETISTVDQNALRRTWDEGNLQQRVTALMAMRRIDPAIAREWLEQSLAKEKAETRARFMTVLEKQLSLDDEPLLEGLLEDRSEQVRIAAAALLRKLPSSRYAARMRERGLGLLKVETEGRSKGRLKTDAPEELPKEWLRDGIPAKIPQGRGKRGYWVEQVMAAVPLSVWIEHFQAEPAELLMAIAQDVHAWEVAQGWTLSLIHIPLGPEARSRWSVPLWHFWTQRLPRSRTADLLAAVERLASILRVMAPGEAEALIAAFLPPDAQNALLVPMLLPALPRPWSKEFSQRYLYQARHVAKQAVLDQAYEWTKSLACAALALPPATFAAALGPWDLQRPGAASWTSSAIHQQVEQFLGMVRLRGGFYSELAAERVSS